MKKMLLIIFVLCIYTCVFNMFSPVLADKTELVTDDTNVHYSVKYCLQCHEKTPKKGSAFLKYGGDYKRICKCHYNDTLRDIHPVDVEPPQDIKDRKPDSFPLQNGKIVCSTCHDIYIQCQEREIQQTFAKKQPFLRGRKGMRQKEFCYQCHDEDKFQRYNPHKQLDENKQIIEIRCLYCHVEVPDVKKSTHEDIKLIGDFVMVCDRCHNKASEKSLHASHLRVPSGKVFASIKQVEIKFGIVLPMDKNGKITCATCHNPHEKGVIPNDRKGAKGADSLHRQRILDNVCLQCHQM